LIVLVKYYIWGDAGHALLDDYKIYKSEVVDVKDLIELNESYSNITNIKVLVEKTQKLHTNEDVKKFASFLLDEGIVVKSEDKNYSMNYLFDVWSGKNPDGLL